MTEGRKSKRIKLSPSELEERNNILLRLQENGEMDRYGRTVVVIVCKMMIPPFLLTPPPDITLLRF